MLLVQLVNGAFAGALNVWGLVPRHVEALPGIIFAPWLHGSWAHLLSNLSGLLVLGSLVLLRHDGTELERLPSRAASRRLALVQAA